LTDIHENYCGFLFLCNRPFTALHLRWLARFRKGKEEGKGQKRKRMGERKRGWKLEPQL